MQIIRSLGILVCLISTVLLNGLPSFLTLTVPSGLKVKI